MRRRLPAFLVGLMPAAAMGAVVGVILALVQKWLGISRRTGQLVITIILCVAIAAVLPSAVRFARRWANELSDDG